MLTRRFLLDTFERVLATTIETAAASLVALGFDDWRLVAAIAGGAAAASLAKAVAATRFGSAASASLVPEDAVDPPL